MVGDMLIDPYGVGKTEIANLLIWLAMKEAM
jgi:hypothetical protein